MSQLSHAPSRSSRGADAEVSRLYAEYGDKLLRFCQGQLRSREEAEDAVQNTFIRVTTALRKGVVPEFEGPWLYKIAHNVCLSRRLGSSRRAKVETPADLDTLGDRAAAHTPDADELFGLDDALADMPPNLRAPLLMREWQGMSYAEIAEALGVSHSAVETLIFRGRRHLAQALTDSVKKSGRAVASIFNIRWLYDFFKGFGGGAGGMGMAAGAAGLVVAIGGGVAVDLATQHASAASRPVAVGASASLASRTFQPARAVSTSAFDARTDTARGDHAGGHGSGSSGVRPGAPASRRGPAGGAIVVAPSTVVGVGTASASAEPASSARSAPSTTQAHAPSKGSGGTTGKTGGSGTGGSSKPPASDPGSVLPPVALPPVVPQVTPPSVSPPALPPVPPVPAVPALSAPPVIAIPGTLVAEATGPLGAAVSYAATAKDAAGNAVSVSCAPASGSTFHLGQTSVSCSATDKQGNSSSATFDVKVQDTTPPALTVPADMTLQTTLASGLRVSYTATATDRVDSAPRVTCSPASGSLFAVQTTTVTCTAADASGNTTSKSFHVTVSLTKPALP